MPSRKTAPSQPTSIHRIKVTLDRTKPPIWRRLDVDSASTLDQLHDAIQASMSWEDSHLHQFVVGDATYSHPAFQLDEMGDEVIDERTATLADIAPEKGTKLRYHYDFGDDWEHTVLVEAVREPDPDSRYPVCITGKRAGPPDDCGGAWGYEALLDTLADPADPEHDDLMEWIGGSWDPEAFDLDEINRRIQTWPPLATRLR